MIIDKKLTEEVNDLLKQAVLNYNRKKVDESKQLFLDVLDKDPSNPEANYYLGLIYAKDEHWAKAVLHFKNVVDLGANFLYTQQCRMLLGLIYFQNQDYKRAEIEYLEVLKSNVNIVQVYAALAAIKYYLDEKEEAIDYAQRAYDMDIYNINAKNTYAFLLCDYGIDIDKGLDMLKEVVRLKPNNAAYLDSLGWAYYKSGNKNLALVSLKKAVDLAKDYPEIKKHFEIVLKSK